MAVKQHILLLFVTASLLLPFGCRHVSTPAREPVTRSIINEDLLLKNNEDGTIRVTADFMPGVSRSEAAKALIASLQRYIATGNVPQSDAWPAVHFPNHVDVDAIVLAQLYDVPSGIFEQQTIDQRRSAIIRILQRVDARPVPEKSDLVRQIATTRPAERDLNSLLQHWSIQTRHTEFVIQCTLNPGIARPQAAATILAQLRKHGRVPEFDPLRGSWEQELRAVDFWALVVADLANVRLRIYENDTPARRDEKIAAFVDSFN